MVDLTDTERRYLLERRDEAIERDRFSHSDQVRALKSVRTKALAEASPEPTALPLREPRNGPIPPMPAALTSARRGGDDQGFMAPVPDIGIG
jgi:hypothetical protein